MIYAINDTHDPHALSWVKSANVPACDFPIQNLPFGVFEHNGQRRIGIAIGDQILDLAAAAALGHLKGLDGAVLASLDHPTLNVLMSLSPRQWSALRRTIFQLLKQASPAEAQATQLLVPLSSARMVLPAEIGDYTDFYASLFHATNVGKMFRPDNPLLPNYKWIPIAYHGRASSIVPSGTLVKRPHGQTKADTASAPEFGPSKRLDYELEVGVYIGAGNRLGEPIPISEAERHAFGLCLVNDWSARDIQAWEYQPLGPFLAKDFLTSVSPWVVTMEALAPFRAPAFERPAEDPVPLPYLASDEDRQRGGIDLTLEVYLLTPKMRDAGMAPHGVSRSSFRDMYWTLAQMITHHASNGCNLQPGDLLASGTVSGPTKDSQGSLLEIAGRGTTPVMLPLGEKRSFLQDGDEVVMRGFCEREGAARIGFGECRGRIQG
jgi:fumarylacetoacetase